MSRHSIRDNNRGIISTVLTLCFLLSRTVTSVSVAHLFGLRSGSGLDVAGPRMGIGRSRRVESREGGPKRKIFHSKQKQQTNKNKKRLSFVLRNVHEPLKVKNF